MLGCLFSVEKQSKLKPAVSPFLIAQDLEQEARPSPLSLLRGKLRSCFRVLFWRKSAAACVYKGALSSALDPTAKALFYRSFSPEWSVVIDCFILFILLKKLLYILWIRDMWGSFGFVIFAALSTIIVAWKLNRSPAATVEHHVWLCY